MRRTKTSVKRMRLTDSDWFLTANLLVGGVVAVFVLVAHPRHRDALPLARLARPLFDSASPLG